MSKFLKQLKRRRQQHLVNAPSHLDKPASALSGEDLEAEIKRLQWEGTKAEAEYWQERQQANASGAEPQFGLRPTGVGSAGARSSRRWATFGACGGGCEGGRGKL
jgi:hypothetical protein